MAAILFFLYFLAGVQITFGIEKGLKGELVVLLLLTAYWFLHHSTLSLGLSW